MKIKSFLLVNILAVTLCFFQVVKLDESIKNDTSALLCQGEMHKSQESIISNEPIRPDKSEKELEKSEIEMPISSKEVDMKVTAYYPVPKRSKDFKNRRKMNGTGITKSGKIAKVGFAAADLRYYPLGTVFYNRNFGRVVVEDKGRRIIGDHHIDIFLKTYKEAVRWGDPELSVLVMAKK